MSTAQSANSPLNEESLNEMGDVLKRADSKLRIQGGPPSAVDAQVLALLFLASGPGLIATAGRGLKAEEMGVAIETFLAHDWAGMKERIALNDALEAWRGEKVVEEPATEELGATL